MHSAMMSHFFVLYIVVMLMLQVVIAFCFIPASYAIVVVKEREVKAKHQQVALST